MLTVLIQSHCSHSVVLCIINRQTDNTDLDRSMNIHNKTQAIMSSITQEQVDRRYFFQVKFACYGTLSYKTTQ